MGLSFGKIPGVPATRAHLEGKIVAIDLSSLLYILYTAVLLRQPEAVDAAKKAMLLGHFNALANLAERGARAVIVLDGPTHALKREVVEERARTSQFPRLAPEDFVPAVELAKVLGIPHIRAPHDAEAQCAWMATEGDVDVVATQDNDVLALGATRMLRNLARAPEGRDGRAGWEIVHAEPALETIAPSLTREALAVAGVLAGCDTFPGVDGIGPKKAIRHALDATSPDGHCSLDAALEKLRVDGVARERARAALALFLDPPHVEVGLLEWNVPNVQRALELLGDAGLHDGARARAQIARIALTNVPPERRVAATTLGRWGF